jgi:hypothetical protein
VGGVHGHAHADADLCAHVVDIDRRGDGGEELVGDDARRDVVGARRTTPNSSPESRATVSLPRTARSIRRAISTSTASPTA